MRGGVVGFPLMRLRFRWHREITDAVLAALLAVIAEYQVFTTDGGIWAPTLTLPTLLMTLPLAVRRRAPVAALAVISAAIVFSVFILRAPQPTLGAIVAVFAAIYSVAAHRPRRLSVPLTVAGAAAMIFMIGSQDATLSSFTWAAGSLSLPTGFFWFIGDTLRQRRTEAAELHAKALRLEREREEAHRRAAADERARIARELHDVVAHSVSVMVVQAAAAGRVLDTDRERAREALRSIELSGRDALAEMRRLLGVIRKGASDEAPLAPQPGLEHLGALMETVHAAGLEVDVDVDLGGGPVPPGVDLSAYRIVQEALTNTLKHADARHVRVAVLRREDQLEVEVSDDGRSTERADGHGHGLIGMRERVAFFGGDFSAGRRAEGGFTVRARFPVGSLPA